MVAVIIAFVLVFGIIPLAISWSAMYGAYKSIHEFESLSNFELLWTSFIDTIKNMFKFN